MTNHELREVLVGLWASLDPDDMADHVEELKHYYDGLVHGKAGVALSPVARAVMTAMQVARAEDSGPAQH